MMQRTTSRTRHLLAGALALVAFGAVPAAAHAGTLQVVPVGLGSVTVSPPATTAVPDPDFNSSACTVTGTSGGRTDLGGACTLTYPAGTTVTLQATGGDDGDGPVTTFRRWSDDRCPGAGPCTLTVGADDQTVAALFGPQRVSVIVTDTSGTSTVTSAPGALAACSLSSLCGDFEPDVPVTFTAVGATPVWLPNDSRRGVLCDVSPDVTCHVLPAWPRWISVGFDGEAPQPAFPPEITVNFHVGKTGAGSGTIRSGSLNCGGQCTTKATFGANETFTATPDNGSRFAGWRAACGNAATCRLAVGPVTSLTAVFDKAAGAVAGTKSPGTTKPRRRAALSARVLGLSVRGHGRRRTLSIRLRVNAASTVRARLLRGRRQVASHRWRVRRAGIQVLRMRVPVGARAGSYRVRVTVSGRGRTLRFTRGVHVRR